MAATVCARSHSPYWLTSPQTTGAETFDAILPPLDALFSRARTADVQSFGYAEQRATTVWLATSSGLRRRHTQKRGILDLTAKSPEMPNQEGLA
jgi:hypothetical protein